MIADVEVEAVDLEAAIQVADEIDLPADGEYCDGSFEINMILLTENTEVYGEQKQRLNKQRKKKQI